MLKNLSRVAGAVAFGLFIRSVLGLVMILAMITAIFSGGLSVDLSVVVG